MTTTETFPVVDYLRSTASNLKYLCASAKYDSVSLESDEAAEMVVKLRAAADQVEKLQQRLAASDRVALGLQQRCATAEHAMHALIGDAGLSHLMPLLEEAQRSGVLDLGRLAAVMPTVQRLARERASGSRDDPPVPGWEPFSSDTVESAQAWAAGRWYRRANGPLPEAPEGRALAPAEFQDNQDWRVEWERGWIYEDQKLARTAGPPGGV